MDGRIGISVLSSYSDYNKDLIWDTLKKEVKGSQTAKIIVLDDDPTGTQTVHDIPVYTRWDEETVCRIFESSSFLSYILTNSRAFSEEKTRKVHREIGRAISRAAAKYQKKYLLVSRGDSTLRGHFPLETETLREELEAGGAHFDGEILCPYFKEGKRFTIHNIHYVQEGNELVPAAETEFARDATFGYHSSDLTAYIEEKTNGYQKAREVICISLEELRNADYEAVMEKLLQARNFQKIIVNAVSDEDLVVFCTALYKALRMGRMFLFRTAASFVRILAGMNKKDFLTDFKGNQDGRGGIIIVGSHTQKTNLQMEKLRGYRNIEFLELDVQNQDPESLEKRAGLLADQCSKCIKDGKTPLVYTSRKLIQGKDDDKEKALQCSVAISHALQNVVAKLSERPSYILAKGGITSSDIATKALKIVQADVLGQAAPGIPVWKTGQESLFADIPYIIFPGNVGDSDTLRQVIDIFEHHK